MERGARASLTGHATGEAWGEEHESIREVEGVMSVNGPAESSRQPTHSTADGEWSAFAPPWARDARGQRKVVPLHLPVAPQLVPAAAPPEGDAAPAPRGGPRPSGPELLAEDAVLKRLLQRHTPDPQPLNVKPVRDPVGLALGMVARLVVAGCGAAAVIMLLLGIIPSPLRLGPSAESDVTPVAVSTTAETAVPQLVADAGGGDGVPAPAAAAAPAASTGLASADVVPPAPARVPTVALHAAQASSGDEWALEPGEVERLVKRGEAYLAQGDIAAARLILGRAAEARDARAAFSLAATYDPAVLKKLHVVGFRPDIAQARAWYEKAAEYGSADASRRLAALPDLAR
jgi:hypothetical protein